MGLGKVSYLCYHHGSRMDKRGTTTDIFASPL